MQLCIEVEKQDILHKFKWQMSLIVSHDVAINSTLGRSAAWDFDELYIPPFFY